MVGVWGGGGVGGGVTISSTELYSLVKIFLIVFKTEGIAALIIKGR